MLQFSETPDWPHWRSVHQAQLSHWVAVALRINPRQVHTDIGEPQSDINPNFDELLALACKQIDNGSALRSNATTIQAMRYPALPPRRMVTRDSFFDWAKSIGLYLPEGLVGAGTDFGRKVAEQFAEIERLTAENRVLKEGAKDLDAREKESLGTLLYVVLASALPEAELGIENLMKVVPEDLKSFGVTMKNETLRKHLEYAKKAAFARKELQQLRQDKE